MNRADAIEQLKKMRKECSDNGRACGDNSVFWKCVDALDIAINSLEIDERYDLAMEQADDMTSSHSEKDIYEGCISLMNDLLRQVYEWLDMVGFDVSELDRDEQFATHFYTMEIVERLFLWNTSHSGGTSQRMKLKELGITDKAVLFDFSKEIANE